MAKGSLRVNGIIVDTDGEIKASTGDSIVIREDDGSAVITVDTAGKVGINTTAPGAQFDIRGPAGTGTAPAGVLRLSTAETSVVDADQLGRVEFIAPLEAGGTDAILVGASIYAEADDTFAADNNATELVFATGASEAAAEKMRLTSDGKLGIGIATPASSLDIRGTVQVGVDNTGHDVIFYGATASSNMTWDESADTLILNDSQLHIDQDDAVIALKITQDAAAYGLNIDHNANHSAIYITSDATTYHAFQIEAHSLTQGCAAMFQNNSSSTATRSVVEIQQDHASATGASSGSD